jgi:TetR/AcrR family transcriptional regulator
MKKSDPATLDSTPPGVARPVRKRNPDESKRRILDAAERAFARRGFDGARLRDIAQEAGVHHALVHHYYGDKRGLFKDVVERALSQVSTTGIESLAGNDVETTTTQLVYILFDFFSTRRDLLRIVETAFRDRESVAHELTAASLVELAAPLLTLIRNRILQGQAEGRVRKDLTADAIIVFGFSLIVYPFLTGSGFMASLGVPRASDEEMASRKAQLARYIVAAIRAPQA